MFARALPSLFTVGNLLLGMISIILAFHNEWQYAAIMVIIGMLLDGLDGRVARMLNTQSEFGKELDSLCDLVSFGVAPAIIMYVAVLKDVGIEGYLVTAIFPICGALRLARFNVHPSGPGYFTGLPITAAGGILATMTLYKDAEAVSNPYILLCGMLFLAYLMVSQIKYPAFKKTGISKIWYWIGALFLIALALAALYYPPYMLKLMFIPLVLYALYGIKKSIERRKASNESDDPVEEMK